MLVVVGGHTRNIGKTSVVAGLIRALPQWNWTAIKVTQFGHGICSAAGKPCDCAVELDHPYALTEERTPGRSDSRRFLAAGARRSYWVRTATGKLANAVPALREIFAESPNSIVESNSLLEFFQPDLFLMVLDLSRSDFKASSMRFLERADAIIRVGGGVSVWNGVAPALWEHKPQFEVAPPDYVSAPIAEFVEKRLRSAAGICLPAQ